MATTTISTVQTSASTTFSFAATQDHLLILQGGALVVQEATAVSFAAGVNTTSLTVDGTLAAGVRSGDAVRMPGNSLLVIGSDGAIRGVGNNGFSTIVLGADLSSGFGQSNSALLRNAGEITAVVGEGVRVIGTGARVENLGIIAGGSGGVQFTYSLTSLFNAGTVSATFGAAVYGGASFTLSNEGTIFNSLSFEAAVLLRGAGAVVANSGLIEGRTAIGSLATGAGDSGFRITNTGEIRGAITLFGAAGDQVVNRGTVTGEISLDAGDDVFDGRGGTVTAAVLGGAGNDTYRISDSDVILTEGADAGIDTVFTSVTLALDQNFERLLLTGSANIAGTGNSAINTVSGNAGDNRLLGLGGSDSVIGGAGDDVLNGGADQDAVLGGDGDDRLIGGLGNDSLDGADGADRLTGGAGADLLAGGADDDTFIFLRRSDSAVTAATADTITDFAAGRDTIDLSALDANVTNARPNDAFTWIGTAAFTAAGQVRHVTSQGVTTVQVNLDSTLGADMIIRLTNGAAPVVGDFVL